jgi:hypothetical protein
MKTRIFLSLAAAGSLCLLQPGLARAAEVSAGVSVQGDNSSQPQTQVQVAPAPSAPQVSGGIKVRLPYGVDDVLKLCRGQVSEDVVVAYVQSSGIPYSLNANDIVYLKQQGVSDRIVSVMLDQKNRYLAANQNIASTQTAPNYQQQDNSQAQPPTTYVQPPSSSVYVIPNTSAYSYYDYGYDPYYYGSYPYYGGYYGSYYGGFRPSFGLSFRFGDHGFRGGGFGGHDFGHGGFSGGHSFGGHGGFSVGHSSGGFHTSGGGFHSSGGSGHHR